MRDTSSPAFPVPGFVNGNGNEMYPEYGMSLRDWFAGQALAGIMGDAGMRPSGVHEFAHLAERLYQLADAMLAERAKP
jgi:hypothetical protein